MAQNERDTGQRLHIVDDGRAREETRNGGEGRLDPGKSLPTLERSKEGGLLAADISSGSAVDHDFQVKAGPLDVLAEPIPAIGLTDGALQALGRTEILAPNVNIGLVTADGMGRDDYAFEQGVRITLQDIAVFEGSGLALVSVDH